MPFAFVIFRLYVGLIVVLVMVAAVIVASDLIIVFPVLIIVFPVLIALLLILVLIFAVAKDPHARSPGDLICPWNKMVGMGQAEVV